MPRALHLIWLVVVVGVLALLGQTLGLYDIPALRDFRVPSPLGQTSPGAAEAVPDVPTPTLGARPLPASPGPEAAGDACAATAPRFVHGTVALKAALGARMGEPLECERVIDGVGDTEQTTTVGLAYYRARSNIAAFTNGWDHWAQTPAGIVHWTGEDLEPPSDAEPTGSSG